MCRLSLWQAGQRVGKDSLRVEAYGTIDELDSALALARAFAEKEGVAKRVRSLQKSISLLMADFASIGKEPLVTAEHVAKIEKEIADIEDDLPEQHAFIVPGDTRGGAMLDLARTIARRAERAYLLAGKAVLLQHRLRQLRQILQEVRHHMRRNLLRPDLEKQISLHAFPSFFSNGYPSSSRCARYASAQRRASLRTRPMNAVRWETLIAPRASSRLNVCEHFST